MAGPVLDRVLAGTLRRAIALRIEASFSVSSVARRSASARAMPSATYSSARASICSTWSSTSLRVAAPADRLEDLVDAVLAAIVMQPRAPNRQAPERSMMSLCSLWSSSSAAAHRRAWRGRLPAGLGNHLVELGRIRVGLLGRGDAIVERVLTGSGSSSACREACEDVGMSNSSARRSQIAPVGLAGTA
jgi:hypothetical protein